MDVTTVEIPVSRETASILNAMNYNNSGGLGVIYRSGRKVLEVYARTKSEPVLTEDLAIDRFNTYGFGTNIDQE